MPIDFKANVADQERLLEEMLARRRAEIPTKTGQIRADIEGGREKAFEGFQGSLGRFGVDSNVDIGTQKQRLGTGLDEMLGNQQFGMQRDRINLAYNQAMDKALDAGVNKREAENFARTIMQDEMRRQQEGAMGERQRKQAVTQQKIQTSAQERDFEAQLAALPNPMDEYNAAVLRMMTGVPSQLLTFYGLNKLGGTPEVPGSGQTNFIPPTQRLNERPFGGYS